MKLVLVLGRFLFSSLFLIAAPSHFTESAIKHAITNGIPMATIVIPFLGLCCLFGGVSVLLGYKAKTGAWLLVLFLTFNTFSFHRFWIFPDPITREIQHFFFIKNISLLGAAMVITYLGSGPWSMDKVKQK